tara:strand:+ start:114 stop:323 length:210 start_codon:yes stop_codon:yes gene_type:complete
MSGTVVRKSASYMVKALQGFAKKRRKLPKKRTRAEQTRIEQLEQDFTDKWNMGNAEIKLRKLLGHKYRN